MDAGITEAELLAAIDEATNAAPGDKPGWRSTEQWRQFWECSATHADILLRQAYELGYLEHDRAQGTNRVGAVKWTPVYRIRVPAK